VDSRHFFRLFASIVFVIFLLPASPLILDDQGLESQENAAVEESAEAVVRDLYAMVTFPVGTTPDWSEFRALFLPEVVVVLRTSPQATSVFTLEGFIEDWLRFIEGFNIAETGFAERIIRTHSTEFGDIAHIWVLYEAEIPGRGRPPQRGVDSFQLVRRDGQWKIASVLNELPMPGREIPEVLRGGG
jgi:hypothetical protein